MKDFPSLSHCSPHHQHPTCPARGPFQVRGGDREEEQRGRNKLTEIEEKGVTERRGKGRMMTRMRKGMGGIGRRQERKKA
ncbi:hypothetical protein E2C01_098539 [Portunus trituberculatus]|uniref:Uncharacterized protein n=1 Tax=Portunus trituberculatus TaxID=210409 RepID=A0A5B7K787_PORTR|nr:hypothetical protein [Portunus trituberculatus]